MPRSLSSLPMVLGFLLAIASAAHAQVERREVGNLILEDIPEIPERIEDRMFQYQSTRSAAIADWVSGGEGMLIGTRFAETWQLHHVAAPGAARRQITFFPEPVRGGDFSPDPEEDRFLFAMDEGGGENYQIYSFDFGDRAFIPLLREEGYQIAQDKDTWAFPPIETLFVQRKVSGTALPCFSRRSER